MKTGIYEMPSEQYHADPCDEPSLSSSIIKIIQLGNMEHARLAHPRLNKNHQRNDHTRFSVGTAAHDLVLEGGTNGRIVMVDPELYRSEPTKANPQGNAATGWNNKAIKDYRDALLADGKVPILKSDFADVERMASSIHEAVATEPDLRGLRLTAEFGKAEQTVIWQEPNGVWCRARPDFLTHDFQVMPDLKTTAALSPAHFERGMMSQMGYPEQLEFYERGIEAITGIRPESFLICAQDFYPFSVFFTRPSQSQRAIAKIKVDLAIKQFGACLESGKWPSWPKGIRTAPDAKTWELEEAEAVAGTLELWDKDAPGAKEAFLFGRMPGGTAGTLEDFDK